MTAAIAQLPSATKVKAPLAPMVKPAQYPTQDVPVHLIVRSETNRVATVDDAFVESIRGGVNSPVLLRPIKATQEHTENWHVMSVPAIVIGQTIYKLVYGERRWLASKEAGHTHIPAIIRDLSESEALKIQVGENEDREDYKPMERAAAYAHLRDQYMKDHAGEKGFTEGKCCALIAADLPNDKIKGRTVQQIIALGKLHKFCQDALNQGEMEASHGYEICRRPEEEQLKLLAWIRKETAHSQGDVPSVRRLKREIQQMDIEADERRWQEKLFKEGDERRTAKDNVEFDGKNIELTKGQLPGSVRAALAKHYPNLTTAFFCKDGRVQLAQGLTSKPFYMTVDGLQALLTKGVKPQTSAPETKIIRAGFAGTRGILIHKPPTEAQIKKEADAAAKRDEEFKRRQDAFEREERIKKTYKGLYFAALAKKAQINSRLLTHVVPSMIFEVWENELPIEAFAQNVLGWPAPNDGHAYTYEEVKKNSANHTRKFTGGLLAAMVLTLYLNEAEILKIAKYIGVDPKRLRKQASAVVKEEDAAAAKFESKAKGQKPKAGVAKAGARA